MPLSNQTLATVYAKTATGQREMQDRSVGLTLLERRLLLLMNGQRRLAELADLMPGQDLQPLLQTLLDKACVEPAQPTTPSPPTASPAPGAPPAARTAAASQTTAPSAHALDALPPATQRTAAQNEMARNFMINSINTVFGQYTRLTLIETITRAQGTDGLRQAYFMWSAALEDNRIGAKRLPELQSQLFKVL